MFYHIRNQPKQVSDPITYTKPSKFHTFKSFLTWELSNLRSLKILYRLKLETTRPGGVCTRAILHCSHHRTQTKKKRQFIQFIEHKKKISTRDETNDTEQTYQILNEHWHTNIVQFIEKTVHSVYRKQKKKRQFRTQTLARNLLWRQQPSWWSRWWT